MSDVEAQATKMQAAVMMEELAALEHERWASWQRYLHSKCRPHIGQDGGMTGALVIPAELVERWERQIDTPYADLSEREKESDRAEVRKYMQIIRKYT